MASSSPDVPWDWVSWWLEPDPNDVDIFLLMKDTFDVGQLSGEARLIYDRPTAQSHFGWSVFWLRRLAPFESEEATIAYWQIKHGQLFFGPPMVKFATGRFENVFRAALSKHFERKK